MAYIYWFLDISSFFVYVYLYCVQEEDKEDGGVDKTKIQISYNLLFFLFFRVERIIFFCTLNRM